MCHGRADREPVNRNGGHDAPDEVSAKDQTVSDAVQAKERDGAPNDAIRFGPYKRALEQQPSEARADQEANEGDLDRQRSVAEERLVDEHGGHCVAHGQEREDSAEEAPHFLSASKHEPAEGEREDRGERLHAESHCEDGQIGHRGSLISPASPPAQRGRDKLPRRQGRCRAPQP